MTAENFQKSWSQDQINEIIQRYNNGETYSQIAVTYGKSPDAIRGVVRRHVAKKTNDIISEETIDTESTQNSTFKDELEEDGIQDMNEEDNNRQTRKPHRYASTPRPRYKEFGRLYTRIGKRK